MFCAYEDQLRSVEWRDSADRKEKGEQKASEKGAAGASPPQAPPHPPPPSPRRAAGGSSSVEPLEPRQPSTSSSAAASSQRRSSRRTSQLPAVGPTTPATTTTKTKLLPALVLTPRNDVPLRGTLTPRERVDHHQLLGAVPPGAVVAGHGGGSTTGVNTGVSLGTSEADFRLSLRRVYVMGSAAAGDVDENTGTGRISSNGEQQEKKLVFPTRVWRPRKDYSTEAAAQRRRERHAALKQSLVDRGEDPDGDPDAAAKLKRLLQQDDAVNGDAFDYMNPAARERRASFAKMRNALDQRQQAAREPPGRIPFSSGGTRNTEWFAHLPTPPTLVAVQRSIRERGGLESEAVEKLITRLTRVPRREKAGAAVAKPLPPLTDEEHADLVDRLYYEPLQRKLQREEGDDEEDQEGGGGGGGGNNKAANADAADEGEEGDEVDIDEQVDRLYYQAMARRRDKQQAQQHQQQHYHHPSRPPASSSSSAAASFPRGGGGGGDQKNNNKGGDTEALSSTGGASGAAVVEATTNRLYDAGFYERRTLAAAEKYYHISAK